TREPLLFLAEVWCAGTAKRRPPWSKAKWSRPIGSVDCSRVLPGELASWIRKAAATRSASAVLGVVVSGTEMMLVKARVRVKHWRRTTNFANTAASLATQTERRK